MPRKIITISLALLLFVSVLSVSALSVSADGGTPWSNAAAWAVPELQTAVNDGLYPDALRGADLTQPVTRAEFAAVAVKLYETLGSTTAPVSPSGTFTDTQDINVLKACALGITDGVGGGLFAPDVSITREAAATMLTRVYKVLVWEYWKLADDASYTAHSLDNKGVAAFADYGKISDWAKPSVYFMAKYGVVKGTGADFFAPQGTSTRQEAIIIADRLYADIAGGSIKDAGPDPLGQDYVISWVDPAFEALVRQGLNKPTGDIWRSELDGITSLNIYGDKFIDTNLFTNFKDGESFGWYRINVGANTGDYSAGGADYSRGQIKSMDDVANFRYLKELTIYCDRIKDISGVSKLRHLKKISLDENYIEDISSLAACQSLTDVQLPYNRITDVAPLSNLTDLNTLSLADNRISDITPFESLTKLDTLYIGYNQIKDISPLSKLSNIAWLDITSNGIRNFSALSSLASLQSLDAGEPWLGDLSVLSGLKYLSSLFVYGDEIKDLDPLKNLTSLRTLSVQGSALTDLTPLSGLTGLKMLQILDTQVSDLTPLSGLTSLTYLVLPDNRITDVTPLAGLINLDTLSLVDNYISDITPLARLTNLRTLHIWGNPITDWSPVANVPEVLGRP